MQTFEQKSFFFAVFYQINMSKNNIIYHLVMYQVPFILFSSGGIGTERKKRKNKDTKNSLRPCIYTTRYKYQGTKYKVPNTMYQCVLLFQNRATKIVPFFRPGFSEFLSYIFPDRPIGCNCP